MGQINKNNYEAFFLDYHEGNLSPQEVADLLLFVEQHPELKEAFENFESFMLEDLSSVEFENKSSLKKLITLENKEEYFIRAVENTLNTAEKNLLTNFIKQHPHYLNEFELFQKTKIPVDDSIVFENKNELKRKVITTNDLLISSLEGLLPKEETLLLHQQLSVDVKLKHEFSLYQQTKLIADTSIVFENKEELKRKEKKVIPLFYFVATAASLLLLFGLSYLFNSNKDDNKFANEIKVSKKQIENNSGNTNTFVKEKNQENKTADSKNRSIAASKKTRNKKQKNSLLPDLKNNSPTLNQIVTKEEQKVSVAKNEIENKLPETLTNNPNKNSSVVIAQTEKKTKNEKTAEFLSLGQMAAAKIKEKTLDNNTLAMQKKNGRLKKFSGWDVAQIITKGISKLTGRNIELKPTYNEEGAVTAYALGAGGFEFSKGR